MDTLAGGVVDGVNGIMTRSKNTRSSRIGSQVGDWRTAAHGGGMMEGRRSPPVVQNRACRA
eukprot:scaffold9117_cov57-Attheya_sp.AAC.3